MSARKNGATISYTWKKMVCPYETTIRLIGNVYNLLNIKELYLKEEPMRFNEIMRSLKTISSKTPLIKLKYLVKIKIVNRIVIPDSPIVVQYSLTQKEKQLNLVLDAMRDWSLKWNMEI